MDYLAAEVFSRTGYYPFGMVMPGRKFDAGSGYRYGFNGKEDDKETGTQDYGMRIYEPRLGRFLSVDPLSPEYPWYTPYQYAGNKPTKFIDLDGGEEKDNTVERYWSTQPKIDMTKAPPSSPTNAAGYPRNALWFFKQLYAQKPEMFSDAAKNSIYKLNKVPIVDEQWVKFNPTHADYMGQQLQHHHINGGKMAVAIPKGLHYDKFGEIHAYLKSQLKGAKIGRGLNGTIGVIGNATLISGALIGDPENWANSFGAISDPEDYVDKRVFKDWESGLYFEITAVTTQTEREWKDGKVIKERVIKREVKANVYSGYIWDDELKRYKGINKVDTLHEQWKYDKDGNRKVKDMKSPISNA